MKSPLASQNSAILVAVAVADHHLLDGKVAVPAVQRGLGHRFGKEFPEEFRAAFQIIKRLEERHDRKGRGDASVAPFGESRLAAKNGNHQQIGELACHADDE